MQKGRKSAVIAAIVGGIALCLIAWAVLRDGASSGAEGPDESGAEARGGGDGVRTRGSTAGAVRDAGRSAAREAPIVSAPRTIFARASWGSGDGQLGRLRPDEANPEAPMSLAAAADGSLVVLDQVNARLVRFAADGTAAGETPLPLEAPQDVAIAPDGTAAVLDRLVDRRVAIVGPDGREVGSLPLEGEGIPEAGGVTAVMIDGEDVYVERENGPLVRIGDLLGRPDSARTEVPGRPTRDGLSYIMAGLIEAPAGRFFVNSIERATQRHRFTRELTVPLILRQILLLDTDDAGVIYVAVAGSPFGAAEDVEEVRLLCLAPTDGTTLGMALLPPNLDPDETMRELVVVGSGGVLYSMRSDEGVAIGSFDCRGG